MHDISEAYIDTIVHEHKNIVMNTARSRCSVLFTLKLHLENHISVSHGPTANTTQTNNPATQPNKHKMEETVFPVTYNERKWNRTLAREEII